MSVIVPKTVGVVLLQRFLPLVILYSNLWSIQINKKSLLLGLFFYIKKLVWQYTDTYYILLT